MKTDHQPPATDHCPAATDHSPRSSQKRIAASRANGAKSKGPVTPEGKRASAANNLRHGSLARSIVLTGENRELFYRLVKEFEAEFQPVGPIESALLQTLVVSRWRQMRIWSIEKATLDHQIGKQEEAVDAPAKAALAFRTLS